MSLDNEKIVQIITMVDDWHHPVKLVARHYGVTPNRIYQLLSYYHCNGEIPQLNKRGRKCRLIPKKLREDIICIKLDLNMGSSSIAEYLRVVRGIHIGSNVVHRILLEEELTQKDPKKSFRRRPWVRYEREHSLSAVHMDWYLSPDAKTWVCAVIDDASRMVLSGGEFEAATSANSIHLLKEAYDKYLYIAPIKEVITDHGSQFYANTRDSIGEADHSFENFCKKNEY